MPLVSGAKLGPYELLKPLGAGGMGEVYRARDTRLDRIVAIKILPTHLSSSTELKAVARGEDSRSKGGRAANGITGEVPRTD